MRLKALEPLKMQINKRQYWPIIKREKSFAQQPAAALEQFFRGVNLRGNNSQVSHRAPVLSGNVWVSSSQEGRLYTLKSLQCKLRVKVSSL